MTNPKRTPKRRSRTREASAEDVRCTLEMAENPEPPCTLQKLRKLIAEWTAPWSGAKATSVSALGHILASPARFVRFMQPGGVIARPVLIFDKATGEVFEHNPRGVRLLNTMSMNGVDFCRVDDEADAWLRARCSGRRLTSSGSIE
jgi:hypothetical protein